MSTYYVIVNLTLSIDEQTLRRARRAAAALGKSLNQLIREHLQELAGKSDREAVLEELRELRKEHMGDSSGWRFDRDELYD